MISTLQNIHATAIQVNDGLAAKARGEPSGRHLGEFARGLAMETYSQGIEVLGIKIV
jgi:hypothetical protein